MIQFASNIIYPLLSLIPRDSFNMTYNLILHFLSFPLINSLKYLRVFSTASNQGKVPFCVNAIFLPQLKKFHILTECMPGRAYMNVAFCTHSGACDFQFVKVVKLP